MRYDRFGYVSPVLKIVRHVFSMKTMNILLNKIHQLGLIVENNAEIVFAKQLCVT